MKQEPEMSMEEFYLRQSIRHTIETYDIDTAVDRIIRFWKEEIKK